MILNIGPNIDISPFFEYTLSGGRCQGFSLYFVWKFTTMRARNVQGHFFREKSRFSKVGTYMVFQGSYGPKLAQKQGYLHITRKRLLGFFQLGYYKGSKVTQPYFYRKIQLFQNWLIQSQNRLKMLKGMIMGHKSVPQNHSRSWQLVYVFSQKRLQGFS